MKKQYFSFGSFWKSFDPIQDANLNVRVTEINDSEYLHKALGISKERVIEIDKMILDYKSKQLTMAKTLEEISKNLNHPNELCYCTSTLTLAVLTLNENAVNYENN